MRRLAFAFGFLLLAACASYPDTGQPATNQNMLTRQEILDSGVTNLYDAVMRLRPRWIRPNTVVYMDGVSIGEADALRDWPQDTAISMEWVDPMRASTRVPEFNPTAQTVNGVILVRTR